jgi:soluble lytic murein transglycosylase-like protein
MRIVVAVLAAALVVPVGAGAAAGAGALPTADALPPADTAAAVTRYVSAFDEVPRTIPAMTDLITVLQPQRDAFAARLPQVQERLAAARRQAAEAERTVAAAQVRITELTGSLEVAEAERAAQEQVVGGLARLLYQQPSPQLKAVEQLIGGEDLRAFDNRGMVTDVLQANTNELERIRERIAGLQADLARTRTALATAQGALAQATAEVGSAAAAQEQVVASLAALDRDLAAAQAAVVQIQAEQEAAFAAALAAAEAAARAAAPAPAPAPAAPAPAPAPAAPAPAPAPAKPAPAPAAPAPVPAKPPAKAPAGFSMNLPATIPFRQVFLSVGQQYGVEPALLAAIARQESNFDPNAGCSRPAGGKGIMQHENQAAYCGAAAVPVSVAKSAQMLAGYYGRFRSWTAAIFAYNNGPGLAPVWLAHQNDPATMIAVLTKHYDASPWATPGPVRGYPSWGAWRARVAYSYAAAPPLPGFRSATATWLALR